MKEKQKKKLPKGLYLRGNIYWMRIADENGRIVFKTTKVSNLKSAETILAKTRVDIAESKFLDKERAKMYSFFELSEEYLKLISPDKAEGTQERDAGIIENLKAFFGDCTLDMITLQNIEKYKAKRLKDRVRNTEKTISQSTVKNELYTLSSMLESARKWGYVRENKARDFEFSKLKAKTIIRWLTNEEEKALLDASEGELDGEMRDMIILYTYTGCSQEEGLKLKWSQVDFQNRTLSLIRKKTERRKQLPRIVPLCQTVMDMLKKRHDSVKSFSGHVFHRKGMPVKQDDFGNAFKRVFKKSQIKVHCRPHDLRHTFASRLAQKGVSLYKIAELLGHSSVEVTKKYAHLCPSEMHADVSVLDALNGNQITKTIQCMNQ